MKFDLYSIPINDRHISATGVIAGHREHIESCPERRPTTAVNHITGDVLRVAVDAPVDELLSRSIRVEDVTSVTFTALLNDIEALIVMVADDDGTVQHIVEGTVCIIHNSLRE